MSRKWIDATEEILLTAILLRTSAALNWPLPYLLAGTLSILNFPSLFPSEDLRYFESCRVRASSGFCVCSMVFIMFVACLVDTSTQLGWLQLGLALSNALAFTFCQIIFSALFSGLSIPLPITATMFTVPCIISAQIMAGCGAFIWDDVVQVSIFSFFCLVLTDIAQMVFPRSFTAGESFLLSALIVQGIFWIGTSTNLTKNSEGMGLIISSGLAAFLATCSIVTSAHLTRKERNSSPKLTNGDWQLALVFHCAILCCVVIVPIWSSLFEFPRPWQWLLQYLYSKCDLVHLGLLGFWSILAYASYVLVRDHAKDNINREMTSRQRKIFHVVGVLAILSGILVDLELTGLVTFALTVLFFWTALYSAYQIYPFGGQVRRILTLMTDHRDSGKIVLTPIYLILGLSLPLWLDLANSGTPTSASFAGVSALGFGDSAASVVGQKFGKRKLFRSEKSIEGMAAMFFIQLIFYGALSMMLSYVEVNPALIFSLFCCSLLEATTDQIDNFILPLFLYPLVRFSSMAESDVIPGRLLDA